MAQSRLSSDPRPVRALYASYFGLTDAPFSIAPDPRFLFMSERHREALAHLLWGIGEGGGFVQLTGEVGTGKTTLCRALLAELPPEVDVALILNPRLTALELVGTICDELRIPYPRETTSLKELVDALDRHLLEAHAAGRRTVLVIDEAQDLGPDVLEQIRLLTNLETEREKLLQIILIGQPELGAMLARPELRQLAQRVTARYHLLPFAPPETRDYIDHRLRVAGRDDPAADDGRVFSERAVREIHRAAGGVPRLINVICDRALLGAYASNRKRIDAGTARQAAREVLGRRARPAPARTALGLAALGLAAALAGAWVAVGPARLTSIVPSLGRASARPSAVTMTAARPPATAAPEAGATPRLADLLATPGLQSDRAAALARLYARWHPDQAGVAPTRACEDGRMGELRCLVRAGTWMRLRPFDVPVVIELVTPAGDRHWATVTRLGDERATLELAERAYTVPLAEVDRYWTGAFWLLWKPPALDGLLIRPGARGKDAAWLRQRLAAVEGGAAATGDPERYDELLKARVIAFQRSRRLVADGIVGEETLAHLTLAAREPGTPSLSAPQR